MARAMNVCFMEDRYAAILEKAKEDIERQFLWFITVSTCSARGYNFFGLLTTKAWNRGICSQGKCH